MRPCRLRGASAIAGELVAVFQRRRGGVIPGGSAPVEKGTTRWVPNYELWRKERKVQDIDRQDLRYDVVVVGAGSAGFLGPPGFGRPRRRGGGIGGRGG